MLVREDADDPYTLFNDADYTDKDYHRQYPTIHHLIYDLMSNDKEHDVRLVHLACAWIVAHRGHFLSEISSDNVENILDFNTIYNEFCEFFEARNYALPWDVEDSTIIRDILVMKLTISRKKALFKEKVYNNNINQAIADGEFPYSRDAIITLLSGGSVKPSVVFCDENLEDMDSVTLDLPEEDFVKVCGELSDDGDLLYALKTLYDGALLLELTKGEIAISKAQIKIYEQHKQDLASLKKIVRKYAPEKYYSIFLQAKKDTANYLAYVYNTKYCSSKEPVREVDHKATQSEVCDFIRKTIIDIVPDAEDKAMYDDIMERLELHTFLPKQVNTDNRIIPQQLYRFELKQLLANAEKYLPFLSCPDESGKTPKDKLLSIFDFRIPYFVGPLNKTHSHAWIERKAEGKIYPWNFEDLVDYDKCEEAFIKRMTNTCTYVAGEKVLPSHSLLYARFAVLNEINNLKLNGNDISVELKRNVFDLVMRTEKHPTLTKIKTALVAHNLIDKTDQLSGTDIKLTSSLLPYMYFNDLLNNGTLTDTDVESIIEKSAYSEDRKRFTKWLKSSYPALDSEEIHHISRLDLKGFGRLSAFLLTGIYGKCKDSDAPACTIIEAMWNTNNNLMQLLSDNYTYREEIEALNQEYYREHPQSLQERLDDMYVSNSVKRTIYCVRNICKDIISSIGYPPEKIFIEMARDVTRDTKGMRTVSRKDYLLSLYKNIKTDEANEMRMKLDGMGDMAENNLQNNALFLYFLQMGKSAYSGAPMDYHRLSVDPNTNNKDHIYPRSFTKDDSINNLILVESTINGEKDNVYPIAESIRVKMRPIWDCWKNNGLITDEKYKRLIRSTPFTDEEKWAFINRQLVETRQSTKVIAQLLREQYQNTQIVYVKADLISEYRQQFDLPKSRQMNLFHHAKDAYLAVVVGNVYDCRFNRRWFNIHQKYSLNPEALYNTPVKCGSTTVWQGSSDVERVNRIIKKIHIHVVRYSYFRKGQLFKQTLQKAAPNLFPIKQGLDTEKYGGYTSTASSFFYLVRYTIGSKTDVCFMPVELLVADRCLKSKEYADKYAFDTIQGIYRRKPDNTEILLNYRPIKIDTLIEVDGLRLNITGKSNYGKSIGLRLNTQLILSAEDAAYIKKLESFDNKQKKNPKILPDSQHDHITCENNIQLYNTLMNKMNSSLYLHCPGNLHQTLNDGADKFPHLDIKKQVKVLLTVLSWFNLTPSGLNLTDIGGKPSGGSKNKSAALSSWNKDHNTMYIIDQSPAGIYEKRSKNLFDFLNVRN